MNATGEASLTSHSIGTLCNRLKEKIVRVVESESCTHVTMESARVIVFDEDIHRSIVVIPSEVELFLSRHRRSIEKDFESDRKVLSQVQRGMIAQIRIVERRDETRRVIVVIVIVVVLR